MQISTTATTTPVDDVRLAEILANPGFGTHFTDHMLTIEWTPDAGWHDARITPYGPLSLDPATAGWTTGRPGGSSEVAGWVRPVDGRPIDPLLLITLSDALPPVSFDLGIPGWVPTIELTVHLRCLPAQGWLRVVQRARLVQGGWLDEECEIWDSTGQLVAQARQLAGYREPAA